MTEISQSLSLIDEYVTDAVEKVETIAGNSREQAQSLRKINEFVSVLDELTKKNTAMFEDTSQDTQHLSEQVSKL